MTGQNAHFGHLSVETYHLTDKIFHIDQVVEFCGNLVVAFL